MMKKLLTLILGLTALNSYATIYVDGNVGANTTDNNFAVGVNVGNMFSKYFGLEGGLTGTDNYKLFDGAVKGVIPLGLVDLYGKLGIGMNSYSNYNGNNSDSSVGLLYGAGVAFSILPHVQLKVEDYTVSGPNPNFLMFGAKVSF
ncbi:MAG: hypothetical protein RLZZ293_714 [Pseudomonadota bacterium]|jgi:hypothetical protein